MMRRPSARMRKAAVIIAELLATTALKGMDERPPRLFAWIWEYDAAEWLRQYCETFGPEGINAWAHNYIYGRIPLQRGQRPQKLPDGPVAFVAFTEEDRG
jgi:hypothetical protein